MYLACTPQFNELGGLRAQAIIRTTMTSLSSLTAAAVIRPPFSRLTQLLALWTLERLAPDVYLLRFPRPVLSLADVHSALRCRVDFQGAAVDGLTPERLTCCKPATV
jgi:hypothetical protein